jgi:hypothetical protein
MSLTEMKDIYSELLKRYKEFGYLRPEDALNDDIHLLETKATGEAILRRYKGTTDETIELMERYIKARARVPRPGVERTQLYTSRSQEQKKADEISAIAQ